MMKARPTRPPDVTFSLATYGYEISGSVRENGWWFGDFKPIRPPTNHVALFEMLEAAKACRAYKEHTE